MNNFKHAGSFFANESDAAEFSLREWLAPGFDRDAELEEIVVTVAQNLEEYALELEEAIVEGWIMPGVDADEFTTNDAKKMLQEFVDINRERIYEKIVSALGPWFPEITTFSTETFFLLENDTEYAVAVDDDFSIALLHAGYPANKIVSLEELVWILEDRDGDYEAIYDHYMN